MRAPWNQPRGSERDEFDESAHHLLARDEQGEIVAVGRIHFPAPDVAQIRYMATREDYRGRGIGRSILARLEQFAVERGANEIILNARTDAVAFYEQLGYASQGRGPTLFGAIEHQRMTRKL